MTQEYIYLAAPLHSSGRVSQNLWDVLDAAETLVANDFIPFVPHLYFHWDSVFPQEAEYWLNLDRAWLRKCHAMLRLPGHSVGADMEEIWAKEFAIPVYRSVAELIQNRADIQIQTPVLDTGLTFRKLQMESFAWVDRNKAKLTSGQPVLSNPVRAHRPLMGATEEIGELTEVLLGLRLMEAVGRANHHELKSLQGIRGGKEEHEAKGKDAVADIIIFLTDYCNAKGWDMQDTVETVWNQVKQRNWVATVPTSEQQEAMDPQTKAETDTYMKEARSWDNYQVELRKRGAIGKANKIVEVEAPISASTMFEQILDSNPRPGRLSAEADGTLEEKIERIAAESKRPKPKYKLNSRASLLGELGETQVYITDIVRDGDEILYVCEGVDDTMGSTPITVPEAFIDAPLFAIEDQVLSLTHDVGSTLYVVTNVSKLGPGRYRYNIVDIFDENLSAVDEHEIEASTILKVTRPKFTKWEIVGYDHLATGKATLEVMISKITGKPGAYTYEVSEHNGDIWTSCGRAREDQLLHPKEK